MREVLRDLEGLLAGQAPAPAPGRELAVAVLAFANVTGRPEDAWLGTGLAETVAAGLASVSGLAVVSRERIVEALRPRPAARRPATRRRRTRRRETGARAGRDRRLPGPRRPDPGHRARHRHRHRPREPQPRVDGTLEGIFDVQDRLVAELVAGLRGQLPAARPEETQSLEAYEPARRASSTSARRPRSRSTGHRLLQRAVALDPGYVRAHVLLGAALDLKGDYLTTPSSARGLWSRSTAPSPFSPTRPRRGATGAAPSSPSAATRRRSPPSRTPSRGTRWTPRPSPGSAASTSSSVATSPGGRGVRAGPRPQPARGLERASARPLRDPPPRLRRRRPRRGGRWTCSGPSSPAGRGW